MGHIGRPKGSHNKGYFYRDGRGWYTKVNSDFVPLVDDHGERLRKRNTPVATIKAACQRLSIEPVASVNAVSVSEVCMSYLDKVKDDGSPKTYTDRRATLFDFCSGFQPKYLEQENRPEKDRIHVGYGKRATDSIKPIDIDRWLAAHKTWKGSRRSFIQAVKRAFNYGVEAGLIDHYPIRGYKVKRQNARVTYITPEQETALLESFPEFALALKVLIRTGARPGCEFCALTAAHVKDHGERMEWIFQPGESKTGKLRTIRITDPEIMGLVRPLLKRKGPIFWNTQGEPWKIKNLSLAFRRAKRRAEKKEIQFDADCVLYSCRHTFAKRILQGFWTGKQVNIETLARLMGNSPQVCSEHYLRWSDSYEEPLWESV
jgi:integrase